MSLGLDLGTNERVGIPFQAFTVNELQLSPALCVSPDDSVGQALQEAWMRDFSLLPVTTKRELLGYLDVPLVSQQLKEKALDPEMPLRDCMRSFQRKRTYQVITPDTGLDELDMFFNSSEFAIVTDEQRKFVLAVCTRADLEKFASRFRPDRSPSPSSVTVTGRP